MNKTNKSLVAFISLFFTTIATLAPASASAALFSLKPEKSVIVASQENTQASWSFDSISDSTTAFFGMDKVGADMALGADILTKKPLSGILPIHGLTYVVEASGYSSTPDQTDDSPFITAKGTHVRPGIIAANFLPFGTVIKIPEVFGDREFVVEDRMNSRYTKHIDIWFPDRLSALQFGRKNVVIEIVSK